MANILTQEDEKNKQQEENSAPQTGGLQGSAGSAPATQNPATANVQAKPQGSGRFTNLNKYLGANQKAGDQLAGGIRDKGDEYIGSVREGIDSAQNVQQGIQGERSRIGRSGELAQGIQTDAVGTAQNSLDEVTRLRLGQNQANQLQGQGQQALQNLSSNINPLDQFGQNLGTESGRFQVLQDVYGGAYKPNYNMGQRRLDQLFLQAEPDNQLNQLQSNIGSAVTDANRNLSSLQKDLGSGIQGIRSDSQQAQQEILQAIGGFNPDNQGAFGSLYSDFGTEQDARRNELQDYVDRARAQFATGTLSQDTADLLGYSGNERVADLDLRDFANRNINLGDTDVTMADVAGRSDLQARLEALSSLAGTDVSNYDLGVKEGQDISFDPNSLSQEAEEQRSTYDQRAYDAAKDVVNPAYLPYLDRVGNAQGYLDSLYGTDTSSTFGMTGIGGPRDRNAPLLNQFQTAYNTVSGQGRSRLNRDMNMALLQNLIDKYNKDYDKQVGIGDISDNLEAGNNFNVS